MSHVSDYSWRGAFVARLIIGFAAAVTGARALWVGCAPDPKPRVYFANHNSHGDFVLLWSSLPSHMRGSTRPVAGADYWGKGGVRSFLINKVFRGVLIARAPTAEDPNPIDQMGAVLEGGESLILFPEGTRNLEDGLLPFKSGLFHLASRCPDVELVPVWIDNLKRVMPKGRTLPLPLLCTLTFGTPLQLLEGEAKADFLSRSREALLALTPEEA
ncbi:1-acyl-sn-glycerol-3-phosphate acyltransferase [Pseudomonas sp. GV071]|jgi:1-acyl-sn-glycerol-3-phosphate acyltransferase|uniref:lysophospholipid acyltransferase family protein n=1 Tax=Pseudomonas sp. GV071 TaxID=2135754 RepID=UPI000D3525EB|nr:lysophospholipid acyltransferase family protein [Pseudomonas sp. GV071]PTQ73021.1 acyltransferase-like protein [Pseudomonas sp. GV071]